MLGALLCSSDAIAAVSIVKYEEQPKLFSIIFGEAIVNDAISIILFQAVSHIAESTAKPQWYLEFEILGQFLLLCLISLSVGIGFGMLVSLLLKWCRFLTVSSIKETLIIFSMGYMTYSVGELCKASGIISLLACGLTMSHYAWYNLSPQGKELSSANI